jgi:hypothetical protein
MKKFIIFFLIISSASLLNGQTISFNSQVMIFPIEKPVIIELKGKQKELKLAWECNEVAEIKVITGKVCLVNSKGEETILGPDASFKVTRVDPHSNSFPLNKTSKYLNEPSVYFPVLYSDKRTNVVLFPVQSKIAKKEHLRFYYNDKDKIENAAFKIYAESTKDVVWESKDFVNEFTSEKITLKKGEEYCWRIYSESNSAKGTFQLLDETRLKNLNFPKKRKNKKEDYINCFFALLDNHCFFDAAAVLLQAADKFPESELLKTLRKEIPEFSTP